MEPSETRDDAKWNGTKLSAQRNEPDVVGRKLDFQLYTAQTKSFD